MILIVGNRATFVFQSSHSLARTLLAFSYKSLVMVVYVIINAIHSTREILRRLFYIGTTLHIIVPFLFYASDNLRC